MWIITAWYHISPEVTVKGFHSCCIPNTVDGTDDDMVRNGIEEVGDARSECCNHLFDLEFRSCFALSVLFIH